MQIRDLFLYSLLFSGILPHKFKMHITYEITFAPAISASLNSDLYHLFFVRPYAQAPRSWTMIQNNHSGKKPRHQELHHQYVFCHGFYSHATFGPISEKQHILQFFQWFTVRGLVQYQKSRTSQRLLDSRAKKSGATFQRFFLPTMGKFEHKDKINECDKLKYIEMLIHVFINYLNLIGHIQRIPGKQLMVFEKSYIIKM